MKKAIIVALTCLNAALLAAVLWVSWASPAQAQVMGSDYLVVTGRAPGTNVDSLYIVDLASRKLAIVHYDQNKKRLLAIPWCDLKRDFNRP